MNADGILSRCGCAGEERGLGRPASATRGAGRSRPPRGRAGAGKENGEEMVGAVYRPIEADRWDRGNGEKGTVYGPGVRTRWMVGPTGRVFPIPRAGVRRRSASGARASVIQKEVQKPENGKNQL